MNSTQFDVTELVSRLERDVARTVGEAHRGLVHETATRVQQFDIADRQAKIVDDVQQALHDEFVEYHLAGLSASRSAPALVPRWRLVV